MKSLLFFCLFYIAGMFTTVAQPFYESYDWDANPKYVSNGLAEEHMASLKEKIVSEFYFNHDGGLIEYFLEHKVYYLNSDDSIEEFNKVYLPYASDSELVLTKARVITALGQVINLDDSKILTANNEETNNTYKYFAFEGIEKGSFIEYLYVVKRLPVYKGKRIDFQSNFLKNNLEFDLYAPSNLEFKFKSYNGLNEVENDTVIENKNHWSVKIAKTKLLERENLAAYDADRQFLVYALDKNTASRVKDISSYANVAQGVYDIYSQEISKKEQSQLKDFLKQIDFKKEDAFEAKLRTIESFIKTNIFVAEGSNEQLASLFDVLKDKVANERGITKLYAAIFGQLNIRFEFVYSCKRDYMRFDKDFEANNFLMDVLFYFPETKKYMSPTETGSRYGFPPAYLTDTYGLFVKEVVIGDFKSAVGKVEYIKPVESENTAEKMLIDVSFNVDDLSNVNITLEKALTGYYGMSIHPFMDFIKPEDKDELIKGFAKNIDVDADIKDKTVNNGSPKLFGIKPLQFVLNFSSDAFVEKAGRKYLFKVGDLIGQQMEMYQERERVLPVENEFQRSYYRTITIAIPKGYTVANLDDISIENMYIKDGKELLSFKSSYQLDGNTLTITADEHYKVNHISADMYKDYRKVINSAADFNKVTLVLEPK